MNEDSTSPVAVVTGAGAGVGRATALAFAKRGYDVVLLSRDPQRLASLAAEIKAIGQRALPLPTDVASAEQVEAAATRTERELGPIEVWVNVAMATVFAPVLKLTPAEVRRATEVTYLGQVHGMMSALSRMRGRNRGSIVNVGSALSYRSVPLQAAYCGAKAAIRGFTDSLRSELIHDRLDIGLTMVHLPAMNTPQFDWSLNKMHHMAKPIAPIFQPEVAADAICYAATRRRRELWVGFSTVKAILANRIAPGLLDRLMARSGYSGQLSDTPLPMNATGNLYDPAPGHASAHGRFDERAQSVSWQALADRHRAAVGVVGVVMVGWLACAAWLHRRRRC